MRSGQFDILDIPVYRLAEHRYTAQRNAFIDKVMTAHPLPTTPASPSISDNLSSADAAMRDHLFESYGGMWRYNEIIGYLRLYFLGTQVRAEYWRVNRKRIVRTRRKIFQFWTWKVAPETELPVNGSSAEIYKAVQEHVESCRAALKGRFVDTRQLTTIGHYIDWRALLHG